MNVLYIDTRDNANNVISLKKGEEEFSETTNISRLKAESILVIIQNLLLAADLTLQDLNKIYCEKGPGSFTGLRVGFSIANTLSLALSIPLNDNEIGTIDTPVYS
jgi:tRNA threonylcarbamoyladenosine biosynthesis protein TsaB